MNPALRRLIPSVILNAALPLLAYVIVRPHAGSDTVALMIGAAIPLLLTISQWIWRRRVDPIGILSLVAFGVVALMLWLTGGNSLVAKLHDAIVTGPLGLAFIVSSLAGHPLLGIGRAMPDAFTRRAVSVMTILLGATLAIHALLVLVLAMTLPTTTFLAVRPVGWLVIAIGLTATFRYRNRARRQRDTVS
jgi:hypothetical protein